ncbi:MAG: N-acetyltransferase [Chloroflexaceae bacterium]|nr:N-acetyltransferase [Chloroflexaceae bacterium]
MAEQGSQNQSGQPAVVVIHPSAHVAASARIGSGTRVWHWAHVREDVNIGEECIVGKGCYIDVGVTIGDRVKIQNNVSVFHGVTIEDGVFVGPHVCFTNDKVPRAINSDGSLKLATDWQVTPTIVQYGASLGAGAVVVCGVTIGRFAMVAAGAVVTRDVPAYGLVVGNPARLLDYVCSCGQRLYIEGKQSHDQQVQCSACGLQLTLAATSQ